MLDHVDDERETGDADECDLGERTDRRNPFSAAQGDDGGEDPDTDEGQLEHIVTHRAGSDVADRAAPGGDREERERATEPQRIGDPVQHRSERDPCCSA